MTNPVGAPRAISKRTRFEIFKRDAFTCQYCGQRPPEVVLEVDHIHPRSQGGDHGELNLVTSCADCNRGKSDKLLGSVAIRPDADLKFLESQQELAEAQRYLRSKAEVEILYPQLIKELLKTWNKHCGWSAPSDTHFVRWLKDHSPQDIEDAFFALARQYGRPGFQFKTSAADYVSGILFNRLKERRSS